MVIMESQEKQTAMQYRTDRKGNKLSILGYGCMRFTKKGNSIFNCEWREIDKLKLEINHIFRFVVLLKASLYVRRVLDNQAWNLVKS